VDDETIAALQGKITFLEVSNANLQSQIDNMRTEFGMGVDRLMKAHDERFKALEKTALLPATTNMVGEVPVRQAAGQKVFSPEKDVKDNEDLNSPTAHLKAPATAPKQPDIVADDAEEQVDEVDEDTAVALEPEPGNLPGSTGSIAQVADDGSVTVHGSVQLDGGATLVQSTVDPAQSPLPSVVTATHETENAKPLGGDPDVVVEHPETAIEPETVIEKTETEPQPELVPEKVDEEAPVIEPETVEVVKPEPETEVL
jgi:hypothetical protein